MKIFKDIVKALAASYLVTLLLLVILAVLMFKAGLSERVVEGGIVGTYILSCFLGGFLIGKIQKTRKFIWGMVIGCTYYAILLVTALILKETDVPVTGNAFTSAVLCIASGMLGGMLS